MDDSHLSDSYLERFVTGLIHDDAELKWVEGHLYSCPDCADRMWTMQEHMDDPESGSAQTTDPKLYREDHPLQ